MWKWVVAVVFLLWIPYSSLAADIPTSRPTTLPVRKAMEAAKRVVFMLDKSGSALDSFDSERIAVVHSLESLKGGQEFGVVTLDDTDSPIALDDRLLPVTEDNRVKARKFLNSLWVKGEDHTLSAFRAAFTLKPDLLIVLTDGPEVTDELLVEIRKSAAKLHCRIDVAYFQHISKADARLIRLAEQNGGLCVDQDGRIGKEPDPLPGKRIDGRPPVEAPVQRAVRPKPILIR